MLEILIIVVLIIANGIFALAEIAVVSARKARLQQMANEGNAGARAALELARDSSRFLSTIQIGITLVGILAGAFGGATVGRKLATLLAGVPWLAPYSQVLGFTIVVMAITYLSLVLGELVPKQIALHSPERLASQVSLPMRLLSILAFPAERVLSLSTQAVLWALRIKPTLEPPVTEEEIRILVREGTYAGVFEQAEQQMVERVLRLGDQRVDQLMTPRTDIVTLDLEDSPEETRRRIVESGYSHFPVTRGGVDEIVGLVDARDLLAQSLASGTIDIAAALEPSIFVPQNMRALQLLEMFKGTRVPAALVIDDLGDIEGLVTVTDVLEAVVGDLPAGNGEVELQAVQREDGSWLLDGTLPVDDFKQLFNIPALPEEDVGKYHTLAGFVMKRMGRVPAVADHFHWGGFYFEVVDMDHNRIDKVLVKPAGANGQRASGNSA